MHYKPHRGCKNEEKRDVIMLLNQQTKVLLALRFYASGNFLQVIGDTVFHRKFFRRAGKLLLRIEVAMNGREYIKALFPKGIYGYSLTIASNPVKRSVQI